MNVRHILIKTPLPGPDGKVDPKGVEAARKKADDILKQLKAGGNFADLAKKYSEDPGSAKNGGSLGWMARGRTVAGARKGSILPGQRRHQRCGAEQLRFPHYPCRRQAGCPCEELSTRSRTRSSRLMKQQKGPAGGRQSGQCSAGAGPQRGSGQGGCRQGAECHQHRFCEPHRHSARHRHFAAVYERGFQRTGKFSAR